MLISLVVCCCYLQCDCCCCCCFCVQNVGVECDVNGVWMVVDCVVFVGVEVVFGVDQDCGGVGVGVYCCECGFVVGFVGEEQCVVFGLVVQQCGQFYWFGDLWQCGVVVLFGCFDYVGVQVIGVGFVDDCLVCDDWYQLGDVEFVCFFCQLVDLVFFDWCGVELEVGYVFVWVQVFGDVQYQVVFVDVCCDVELFVVVIIEQFYWIVDFQLYDVVEIMCCWVVD